MSRQGLGRSSSRCPLTYQRFGCPVIETLEERCLLSASDPLQVLIGGGAAKSVQYIDPNGVAATILLNGPGTARVTFNGSGLTQSANARGVVVSGGNVTVGSIAATQTTVGSTLQVLTRGRKTVTAGDISSDGSFAAIRASSLMMTGDVTIAGWVHQMQLEGAQGGTISIGPAHLAGAALVADLGSVSDESLQSMIPIQSLKAAQWVNTTGGGQTLQAPQIVSMAVKGAFTPDLSIQGAPLHALALTHFQAASISGGSWNIGGSAGVIQTPAATGWSASFTGVVATLVIGSSSANITAGEVTNFTVHGTLSNSTVRLTNPLASNGFDLTHLNATGEIDDSKIISQGSIGTITATKLVRSTVYAGVTSHPTAPLPTTRDDLVSSAEIKLLMLRRTPASFIASDVAAFSIGSASLATVVTNNGGVPFGLAANQIGSVSFTDSTTGKSIHLSNPASTAAVNAALAAKGINPVDFAVRLL